MKRTVTLILSALMVLCVAFATTGCGEKKRDPNVLTVYIYQQETEQDIYKAVANQFQTQIRKNAGYEKFEVKLSFGGGEDYFRQLKADASAKTLADIIYVRPGDVRQYVKTGLIKNLSEHVTENDVADIWENAVNFFRFDTESDKNGTGNIYALPKDYSQYMLGFNTIINSDVQPYVYTSTSKNYTLAAGQKAAEATEGGTATDYKTWTGKPLDIYDGDGNYVRTDLVKLPGMPGTMVGDNYVVYTFSEFGHLAYLATKRSADHKIVVGNNRRIGTGMWEEMCLMAYVWGDRKSVV